MYDDFNRCWLFSIGIASVYRGGVHWGITIFNDNLAGLMSINVMVNANFGDIERGLAGLTERLARQAVNGALLYGSTPMLKTAKLHAAKAEADHKMKYGNKYVTVHPGLLKDSIKRRRLKKGELAKIGASAGYAIYVGKGKAQKLYPRYWHFIEFGTSRLPPAPYFRPAFELNKQVFLQRFCQKMQQNIVKYTPTTDAER